MDEIKVTNYERDFAGRSFPAFSSASTQEVAAIRARLAQLVGMPEDVDGLTLVRGIASCSRVCEGLDAAGDDFSLARVLTQVVGADLACHVYLNWSQFGTLDRMSARDVAEYFSDIWYPGADDLDIIDEGGRWVVVITHYGTVRALQL